ncbi:hypothetical protein ACLOJK_018686 [Asimina triloba]
MSVLCLLPLPIDEIGKKGSSVEGDGLAVDNYCQPGADANRGRGCDFGLLPSSPTYSSLLLSSRRIRRCCQMSRRGTVGDEGAARDGLRSNQI